MAHQSLVLFIFNFPMLKNTSSTSLIPLSSFLLLLLHFLLLSPYPAKAQNKNNNLIQNTCKSTPNYALCVSTLRSNPRSSNADVTGLGLIIVDAVKSKSTAELQSIRLSNSSPKLKRELSECIQDYKIVLSDLIPEAVEGLTKGDPKFAEDGMNGVVQVADQCVKHLKPTTTTISANNKIVHNLSLVAVSIIRMLL